ncbi:MAG: leucine-rich repeat domain-containing protein [Clostridia bacterium]|nr:leucine-rich repeat domain-containing protein [Clostridia bacterium]
MKKIALRLTALVLAVISITMLLSSCSITVIEDMDGDGIKDNEFKISYAESERGYVVMGYTGTCPAELIIPDTYKERPIVRINGGAFSACPTVEKLTIGNNVTRIGTEAFMGCSALKSLTFGKNLERIDSGAFKDCYELSQLTLPEKVDYIGANAFLDCVSLKLVYFGNMYDWKADGDSRHVSFVKMDSPEENAKDLVENFVELEWTR